MFTGITRGLFPVTVEERRPGFLRYAVTLSDELLQGLVCGASVAVDGVCQTVVSIVGRRATFEAIEETLDKTTLGGLRTNELVSIERSATLSTELGGHLVAGHVWGTALIERVHIDDDRCVHDLWLRVPGSWMRYLYPKGFVALDGSSLTIGACETAEPSGLFSVHLIPETVRLTRLGKKGEGERVNLELDAQTVCTVETVERILAQQGRL